MVCSAVDELPSLLGFDLSQQSELVESGLLQDLESHYLFENSSHDATSLLKEIGSQSNRISSQNVTPDTSLSQSMGRRAFRKLKKRAGPQELH